MCLPVGSFVHHFLGVEVGSPLALFCFVDRSYTRVVGLYGQSPTVAKSEKVIDDLIMENIRRYTTTIERIEVALYIAN